MGDALSSVEQIYFSIQSSLNDMIAAAASPADRDAIMSKYVAARQNYWTCIGKSFHDDDPAVIELVKQAQDVATSIQNIDDQLGDIAKVIGYLNEAVTVGTKIAARIITL